MFLILVARAVAPVWEVTRSTGGVLCNLAKKRAFVNHYSFHIMDPEWGHMTIKMSGHPPFGAQVILNGHEYVAAAARAAGIGYVKEGNCFTRIADPAGLAQIADTLSQPATIGRLTQVMRSVDLHRLPVLRARPRRAGSAPGSATATRSIRPSTAATCCSPSARRWTGVFDRIVDRTRSRLDVPILRTLFGAKQRPGRNGTPDLSLRLAAVIETPRFDLTLFKLHFGNLTLKAYTKGEHVLRFEAVVHNTRALRCGRVLDNFPTIIGKLAAMVDRFSTTLDCVDTTFIGDDLLDRLPTPAQIGATRVGGVDLNKPRIRAALSAVLALSAGIGRFHRRRVHRQGPRDDRPHRLHDPASRLRPAQTPRQAPHRQTRPDPALPPRPAERGHHRRPARPARAGHRAHPRRRPQPPDGRKPITWTSVDRDYEKIRIDMQTLFQDLGIRAAA